MKLVTSSRLGLCALFCLQSITLVSGAQKVSPDVTTTLRSQLVGKQLVLRNMSADRDLHGTLDGTSKIFDPPSLQILAVLTIKKVQVNRSRVQIEAIRHQILRDKTGGLGLAAKDTPVTLTLALHGDPAALVPTLRDLVFFPNVATAMASLSKDYPSILPFPPDLQQKPDPSAKRCDCADTTDPCETTLKTGIAAPKVIKRSEPDFSEDAMLRLTEASVGFLLRIDEKGDVAALWLVHESGLALDEEAALAVHQSKFAPATCHGKPIRSDISEEFGVEISGRSISIER